jgi:hypothetical protein
MEWNSVILCPTFLHILEANGFSTVYESVSATRIGLRGMQYSLAAFIFWMLKRVNPPRRSGA